MEENVAVLAPPVILSPKEGDEVETLIVEGTGVVGYTISINWSFFDAWRWEKAADVGQDRRWYYQPPKHYNFDVPQTVGFRVRHEHWSGETSEPSPQVTVTKLLAPPTIDKPSVGESLPQNEQRVEGTAFYMSDRVEIEMTKIVPPALTYRASARPDTAGWWKATPEWSLMPGPYALKCRQIYKEHTSRWSDDLIVEVK